MENKVDIKKLQTWVYASQLAQTSWREQSWEDCKMYDGGKGQWTDEKWAAMEAAGVDPITINRTFPACNLILGLQATNQYNLIAKGRTNKDGEISQTITEAVQFVIDQNNGKYVISEAFRDQIIPGFGCVAMILNSDPRKEKIGVSYRHWAEMGWDPFSSPWWNSDTCRYVFHQKWVDLEVLKNVFPSKAKEVDEVFELSISQKDKTYTQADEIEDEKNVLSWGVDEDMGQRVKPVEMWYTVWENRIFAIMPDNSAVEIKESLSPQEKYGLVSSAKNVARAVVKKMRVAIFLGDLVFYDIYSPFPHDEFPFIPFVSYMDRYLYPYGIPRQIRDNDIEVNIRRSMALAVLKARRVIAEKGCIADGEEGLQRAYEEANKLDGFIVTEEGKGDRFKIIDQTQLMPSQIDLLRESEREIMQIAGVTAEQAGYQTNAESGVAIQQRIVAGGALTAPIFENLKKSKILLGEQIISCIQGFWTGERILRVTDRFSGAERFVALNQKTLNPQGLIEIKNDITNGKFDLVVSESAPNDTVREQNLNLIIEWVKKSPPDIIPYLMQMAFELSNIPNKDVLLEKLRPILGDVNSDMSPEEAKKATMATLEAQKKKQEELSSMQIQSAMLDIKAKELANEETAAKIEKILNKIKLDSQRSISEITDKQGKLDVASKMHDVQSSKVILDYLNSQMNLMNKNKGEARGGEE